jgi:hypothetical protein
MRELVLCLFDYRRVAGSEALHCSEFLSIDRIVGV